MGAGAMSDLPPGFVLDSQQSAQGLPPGFVLDQATQPQGVTRAFTHGAAKGFIGSPGTLGDIGEMGAQGIGWIEKKLGIESKPELYETGYRLPRSRDVVKGVEDSTGSQFYTPPPNAPVSEKFAHTIGEFVGNPVSYLGPGRAVLKIAGALLGGAGSEAGGQALEGTGYEGAGRVLGGMAGGVTAGKTLGPTQPKAAIPTSPELLEAGVSGGQYGGYKGAAKSGLELDPTGVASSAAQIEQHLYGKNFSGGPNGTAQKTFSALADLQQPPTVANGRAFVGPANIEAVRERLKEISKEVQLAQGGATVGTKDAAAASAALERLNAYAENIPKGHILAGDAAAYTNAIKEANANYGAGARLRDYDARLTKAERATDRQIAGSLDSQIKTKAGQMLDRGAGGMNSAERSQLELINSGGPVSNTLRQLGRGGAGVIPLGTQAAMAAATGGAFLPAQAALAAALYGARKGSEAITKSRANKLAEMLAKRSPEYESRVSNLPQVSSAPNVAALARALMATR